jgi:hypothetical protein
MPLAPAALFGPEPINSSTEVLLTVVANGQVIIKRAVFTNTHTAVVTLSVYVVRSGDSPDGTNLMIDAYPLSSGQAYVSPELANCVLDTGDTLQAVASVADKILALGSGYSL